jgi:NAD(P)H-hydrate epimerase
MSDNEKDSLQIVLSRQQVRQCDQVAIDRFGVPGVVLMENAGRAAARIILNELNRVAERRVCLLAGTGNNGGDGFVVARHLFNRGVSVDILIFGPREKIQGDALINLAIAEKMSLPISYRQDTATLSTEIKAGNFALVIDAMLGTGTAGPPREPIRSAIRILNALDKPVVSLDIPSGLDCDTGQPLETAVYAKKTITFAALKKGFLQPQAHKYTGEVSVASIGIATSLLIQDAKVVE